MNYQSSSFGGEGSWNKILRKGKKVEIPLKFHCFFYLLTYLSFKRASKQNNIDKSSNDDKLLSWFIKKRVLHKLF